MTDAYRQKLLNWFCSMALLLLICSLAMGLTWWRIIIHHQAFGYLGEFDVYAPNAALGMMAYFLFFPAIAFWHFCDFLQRTEAETGWNGVFSTYRGFARLLLLMSPLAVLGAESGVQFTGCYGVFYVNQTEFVDGRWLFDECPGADNRSIMLVFIAGPLIGLACLSKAVSMFTSWRTKR